MKQIPGQMSFEDWMIPEARQRPELGQTFTTHGKRIMFEELADYYVKDIPVLINSCTESQESYKLVKVEDVSRDRMTFSYGTNHRGYISRRDVNGNRGRINFECDACNEGGWVYSQDGEPETHPRGNKCLLNVDHVCTKHCDAVIRQDCTEWKPNVCQFSGHECNKKELWKVADSLDDTQCPHVCCRRCNTRRCGARCNGSEEPVSEKRYVVNGGKWEGKCATCSNWAFNAADSCSCEHADCKAPEYSHFRSAIEQPRRWHRANKQLPEKSGYYDVMDVDGKRGRAWFERGRGFDHVTGRAIEAWRDE